MDSFLFQQFKLIFEGREKHFEIQTIWSNQLLNIKKIYVVCVQKEVQCQINTKIKNKFTIMNIIINKIRQCRILHCFVFLFLFFCWIVVLLYIQI